jgi:hypothetical protein
MDVIAGVNKRQDAITRATRHVLTGVAMYLDNDSGNFENVLY